MTTRDYQRAADSLRYLRVEMLVQHAMRPSARGTAIERLRVFNAVGVTLFFHQGAGVPYSTTYEVLRQNRHLILGQPQQS